MATVNVMRFFIVAVKEGTEELFKEVCNTRPYACAIQPINPTSTDYKRYELCIDRKDFNKLIAELEQRGTAENQIIFAEVMTGWDTCNYF